MYNVTLHLTSGYLPYYLLIRVHSHLLTNVFFGWEQVAAEKLHRLVVQQEHLRDAHARIKKMEWGAVVRGGLAIREGVLSGEIFYSKFENIYFMVWFEIEYTVVPMHVPVWK